MALQTPPADLFTTASQLGELREPSSRPSDGLSVLASVDLKVVEMATSALSFVTECKRKFLKGKWCEDAEMGATGLINKMYRSGRQSDQLLPGLPDDVTLYHICTKLPCSTINVLSSINPHWRKAIRSREVYNARVRSNSTETLLVCQFCEKNDPRVSMNLETGEEFETKSYFCLYSLKENVCYNLPGMPHLDAGFPENCEFVALDGNLFCSGSAHLNPGCEARREEYGKHSFSAVDLGGHQQWKSCAGMEVPRVGVGLGVVGGKIYTSGGSTDVGNFSTRCEVYDREKDVWSFTANLTANRSFHYITTIGGQLFAYSGLSEIQKEDAVLLEDRLFPTVQEAFYLEVYDSSEDEWRLVKPFGRESPYDRLFVSQGKFHLMSSSGIFVLDGSVENNKWTELHSFSLEEAEYEVLDMDGELLLVCRFVDRRRGRPWLFQSKGFGKDAKELVWEALMCPLPFVLNACTIQL